MQFHDKLFRLRKEKGLTQAEVAEQLDVSRQSVSKWEMGTTVPDLDKIKKISRCFNVSIDYLVNDNIDNECDIPIVKEASSVLTLNFNFLLKRIITALCVIAITSIIAIRTHSVFGMFMSLSMIGLMFMIYYGIRLFFLIKKYKRGEED